MKIPVKISPFFWLTAGLIGWINSMNLPTPLLFSLLWVFVIFISILVHEYGHAITSRYFGQKPRIQLVAFGGLTFPEGSRLKGWREFLVILNGPIFGFSLFLLSSFILATDFFTSQYIVYTLRIFQWVNLFWTIINLLPVMPMDGGQLLRVIFESVFGAKGVKYSLISSALFAGVLSVVFFLNGFFLVGAIFFLFAFQNYGTWKNTRLITESDRDDTLANEMKEIENLLKINQKEAVTNKLESVRFRAKQGMIFNAASEYLAALKSEKGKYKEVYDILKPIKNHLSPESQICLHRAAYEMQDFPLVLELAGPCFQILPDPMIAVRSAEASAALTESKSAIGWLRAARKEGIEDFDQIISKKVFDSLRGSPEFDQLEDNQ